MSSNDVSMPVTPEQPLQMTDEQKDRAVKEYIAKQFNEKYQDISKLIGSLPFDEKMKFQLFWDMDRWYLMASNIIAAMQLPKMQSPQPAPEAMQAAVEQAEDNLPKKRKYSKKKKAKNGKRKSA